MHIHFMYFTKSYIRIHISRRVHNIYSKRADFLSESQQNVPALFCRGRESICSFSQQYRQYKKVYVMCVHVNKIDLVPYSHIMLLTLQPPATSVSILMTKKKSLALLSSLISFSLSSNQSNKIQSIKEHEHSNQTRG